MENIITAIVESQAPWMMLCVVLIIFIIKLQNDKMTSLCDAVQKLVVLYEAHDKQAKEINEKLDVPRDWCIAHADK